MSFQDAPPSVSELDLRCQELRSQRAREAADRRKRSARNFDPVRLRVLDWVLGKVLRS